MPTYDVTLEAPTPCGIDGLEDGETTTIRVDSGESVLAAARRQGIWLPADCQQGWCTTCAGEVRSGDVDQSNARRYYDADREADFVLLCVARPRSDLHLRLCRQEELLALRAAHELPPARSR